MRSKTITIDRVEVRKAGMAEPIEVIPASNLSKENLNLTYSGTIDGLDISREAENEITFELIFKESANIDDVSLDYTITTGQSEIKRLTNNGTREISSFTNNQLDFEDDEIALGALNATGNTVSDRDLVGNDMDNTMKIRRGNNNISGNGGDDLISLLGGVNFVDGGEGVDTVILDRTLAEAGDISQSGNLTYIGTNVSLVDVEFIQFRDTRLAADTLAVAPTVSLEENAISVVEGNIGSSLATFVVNLSNPSTEDVAIDVSFESGLAEATNDFVLPTQPLVIPAGETTGEITLEVVGDELAEGDEEILLDLAVAENATFANGATSETVGVNIADDDSEIFVSLIEEESGISEGDLDRPSTFSLTLNRFGGLTNSDVVAVEIVPTEDNSVVAADFVGGISPTGSLVAGLTPIIGDLFGVLPPKLVTFATGEDSKTVRFAVSPDFKIEDDETFAVELSGISGSAKIFSPDEIFTIFNDDDGNSIVGDDDSETIVGTGQIDVIEGLEGNDEIFGRNGNDVLLGGDNNDTLHGENDGDRLFGESGIDILRGDGGNDSLFGGDGDDLLLGDTGDDRLEGGAGKDRMYGNEGSDFFKGGTGNDTLSGGAGFGWDTLKGEGGDDSIAGGGGKDLLQGGNDEDTLFGNGGDDRLFGDAGNDLVYGNTGNDLLHGWSGNDTLKGEDGDDYFDAHGGNDLVQGGFGNDEMYGKDGNDRMYGNEGNDLIQGGFGNDYLVGSDGSDILKGEIGKDTLFGGNNNDLLQGGDNDDRLYGQGNNDRLFGNAGNDLLVGNFGNDRLAGSVGRDTLKGEVGRDILTGGDNDDLLQGGDDNDLLYGNAGNDRLFGNSGNDRLDGGLGQNRIAGGAGEDEFVFTNSSQSVGKITDFTVEDDTLVFKVSSFAGVSRIGIISSNMLTIGSSATDSSDRFVYNPASGDLFYDSDGNGSSQPTKLVNLDAGLALSNSDFEMF